MKSGKSFVKSGKSLYYNAALKEKFIKEKEVAKTKDISIHYKTTEKGEVFFHFINKDCEILCRLGDVKIEVSKDLVQIKINNLPKQLTKELEKIDI